MAETPAEQQPPDDDQEQHIVGEPLHDAWAFVYRSGPFTAALWGCGR